MHPLDVGIIGCGTAGSAAAVFLARSGHRVTLYERVPAPQPVGAGITLQPTGLHVLCRLGLYMHVVTRGARIDRLLCEAAGGGNGGAHNQSSTSSKKDSKTSKTRKRRRKAIVDLTYESVGEGLFGLGLHRGVLFEALYGAAQQQKRVLIKTGVEIVDLARAETTAGTTTTRRRLSSSPLSFRRPSWLVDNEGRRHGPHDLVVVADGARSKLRDDTSTSKSIAPYPWGALWFVGRQPLEKDDPMARVLHQVVDGNQTFLGLLPTGLLPGSQESTLSPSPQLVSLFWSIRGDRVKKWREDGIEAWKANVLALAEEAAPLLDQIHDEGQLLYTGYHDVVMHRWNTRNVVYIGDAAHATSPQLGQGCNLALWDAMELSDCVDEEPRDLTAALYRYSRRREEHIGFYQTATRWLTPFFQSDAESLGALRDVVMPLMGKVSVFRRLMTLSMLGVMENFYGRTLTLRLPAKAPE